MDSGLYLPHVMPLQDTPPSLDEGVSFLRSAITEPHPDSNTRIIAISEKDLSLLLASLQYVERYSGAFYNVAEMVGSDTQYRGATFTGGGVINGVLQPAEFRAKTDNGDAYVSGGFTTWSPTVGGADGLTLYHNGNFNRSSQVRWENVLPGASEIKITINVSSLPIANKLRLFVQSGSVQFIRSVPAGASEYTFTITGETFIYLQNMQGGSTALKESWKIRVASMVVSSELENTYRFLIPEKRTGRWAVGEEVGGATIAAVGLPVLGDTDQDLLVADYWQNRIDELRTRMMVDLTEYLQDLAASISLIEEHNERLADATERIATALESQATGEGLEDIAGAIGALAPLLAA